jgi:enoyl-[acyl-carrier protein] reductase/trans-2-enoyl-CoA reductase (NAD+)
MIVRPMIRNNICLSAHPAGCEAETLRQIEYIKARAGLFAGRPLPKAVLVLGASGGYGLASRITAAFGCGAATVGLSFERAPSGNKTGTPGFYCNRAFDAAAAKAGLVARSLDMDAFTNEAKDAVIALARELGLRFDLVVYSLASPVRTDPATGILHRSVIKPIGQPYTGTTVDVFTGALSSAEVAPATEEEVASTVKVMGGEDWRLWIEALAKGGVLAEGANTLAYSYLGPSFSWPIYRDGAIGRAKIHLDATAKQLTEAGPVKGLHAYVSVNKAVVTRASAVIPIIPLYVSVLFKVMKARGNHEDCIAQADRLFRDRLYVAGPDGRALPPPVDEEGRIRLDDLELSPGVQAEVEASLAVITSETLRSLADINGFRDDFLAVHGFGIPGVDYEAETD